MRLSVGVSYGSQKVKENTLVINLAVSFKVFS